MSSIPSNNNDLISGKSLDYMIDWFRSFWTDHDEEGNFWFQFPFYEEHQFDPSAPLQIGVFSQIWRPLGLARDETPALSDQQCTTLGQAFRKRARNELGIKNMADVDNWRFERIEYQQYSRNKNLQYSDLILVPDYFLDEIYESIIKDDCVSRHLIALFSNNARVLRGELDISKAINIVWLPPYIETQLCKIIGNEGSYNTSKAVIEIFLRLKRYFQY